MVRTLSGISLIAASAAVTMAAAVSGSLDPSFGRGGRAFASFSGSDTASGVAVQRSGEVLVSGRVGGKISIVQFDARGRLDRTFGRNGLVREAVGADPEEGPVRIVLQGDGRIVLAGATGDFNSDRQLGDGAVAVYRLRPDGSADVSFGSHGAVLLRRQAELLGAELAIDRSGRIVIATRYQASNRGGILVERLTTRGRLDPAFGHGGEQSVRFGTQSFLGSAAVDRRGRVYVAGADFATRMLSVLRLTSRGSLDSGFGRGGIAQLPRRGILALPEAVAVQPDGRVLLAGEERLTGPASCGYCLFLTLARLTPGGRPDRTFGQAGVVHTRLELTPSPGLGLALQRDGRIVVAGGIQRGLASSFLLARFLRTGAVDPSFGSRGSTVTDMRSAKRKDDKATALAIAPDGRVVVAGRSARDALEGGGQNGRIQYRFAVARFAP